MAIAPLSGQLALVLSLLCSRAHRVTKDFASGPLPVENDEVYVHNTCKELGEIECRRDKADTCVWDLDKATGTAWCRPRACARLFGDDCRELSSYCLWVWISPTKPGGCKDLVALAAGLGFIENPCKELSGSDCLEKGEMCTWDQSLQTGNCRPKTCAGIKASDCRDLRGQCTWTLDRATQTGACVDLSKIVVAKSRDNPCKNLPKAQCLDRSFLCEWNPSTANGSGGECRPEICAGIAASDCLELEGQCVWKPETSECLEASADSEATAVASVELTDNPCKGLKVSKCRGEFDEVCVWDWSFQTSSAHCRPRTCAGIKGSDCRELTNQCIWRREEGTETGACLDIPQALVDNPCKHLTARDCETRRPHCQGQWDPLTQTAYCGPRTCVGLKGGDCQNLTSQCIWTWNQAAQTGECVDLPKAPTSNPCKEQRNCTSRSLVCDQFWVSSKEWHCRPTTCAGIEGKDCRELSGQCAWWFDQALVAGECLDRARDLITPNPCRGLTVTRCDFKKFVCEWYWDVHTQAASCRPLTCKGLYQADCRNLTNQCAWRWNPVSEKGECLDLPKAMPPAWRDDPCKKGAYSCPSLLCQRDFSTSWTKRLCRPKTCAGLRGSDCRELSGVCVWRWDRDSETGKCLDLPEDNPCKDLNRRDCTKVMSDACMWIWDLETSRGSCQPKTCAGIKEADCRSLRSQCAWTWLDRHSQHGECRNLPQPPPPSVRRNPCAQLRELDCWLRRDVCTWELGRCRPNTCDSIEHHNCKELSPRCAWRSEENDSETTGDCIDVRSWSNSCKDLAFDECMDQFDDCAWDEPSTICRPRTCAHIKESDCMNLTDQCVWRWYPKSAVGRCQDLPKRNVCKDIERSDCKARPEVCWWDWDLVMESGTCRPLRCEGISESDCMELKGCIWRSGECQNPPPWGETTVVHTVAGPRPTTNICHGLTGVGCKLRSEACWWDWDKATMSGTCKPITRDPDSPTNASVEVPAPVIELRSNPCKDLDSTECRSKSKACLWGFDKATKESVCKPVTCVGLKRFDCRELLDCTWKWRVPLQRGECMDRVLQLESASSETSTTVVSTDLSAGFVDPCKGLHLADCTMRKEVCKWTKDKCRPKSCVGIRGTDCLALRGQCTHTWDKASKSVVCVDDLPVYTNGCMRLSADQCKKAEDCKWLPRKGWCRPRTCAGLNNTECRRLHYQCLWKWDPSSQSGACWDIFPSTTATTSSAGDRAAQLLWLVLANFFFFFLAGAHSPT